MSNDFDFFHGRWRVEHRRLKSRLTGSTDWEAFTGVTECRPLLGGHGNIDDNIIDLPSGSYRAITLRSFDPGSQKWAIWWLDARNPHALDTPVVGGFTDGIGRFFAEDTHQGASVLVLFQWTVGASPVWEQALSADGGANWETNWTMHFVADPTAALS